jgi:hypothetical protein
MASWDDAIKAQQSGSAAAAPAPAPSAPAQAARAGGDLTLLDLGKYLPDWATRPVAKTESPLAAAQDYGLSIGDAATMGLVGKALGPGAQDAIAEAHKNLGLMDYAAQGIGYGMAPGQLIGRGAAAAVRPLASTAGRFAGSVAAGGLEGAAAGAGNVYGHNQGWDDLSGVPTGALIGSLMGMAGGAAGGEAGPAPKAPETGTKAMSGGVPATGMYAEREAAYKPLDSIYFKQGDYAAPVNQATAALRAARDPMGVGLQGEQIGITPEIKAAVQKIVNQPLATGRNIQEASQALKDINTPVAHQFATALDSTLANAQPVAGSVTKPGVAAQIGDAAKAQQDGNLWHGRIRDLETLDNPTPGAIKQVQSWPQNAPGTPAGNALETLAQSQRPSFSPYAMRHMIAPAAGAVTGGVEGYINAAEGQNPWTNAAIHSGEEAMLFSGLHAAAAPRPAGPLNAARYAIGTGKPITTPRGDIGNYLMNLWAGNAGNAANAVSGNQPQQQ